MLSLLLTCESNCPQIYSQLIKNQAFCSEPAALWYFRNITISFLSQDNITVVKDEIDHPMSIVSSTKSRWVFLLFCKFPHPFLSYHNSVLGSSSDWLFSTVMVTWWITWASPSSITFCRVSCTSMLLDRARQSAPSHQPFPSVSLCVM